MSRASCWLPHAALLTAVAVAAGCTDPVLPRVAPHPPHNLGTVGCIQPDGRNICVPACPGGASCTCGANGADSSCSPPKPPTDPPVDNTPPSVRIVVAVGPNPERSFTTLPAERGLAMAAAVTPVAMRDAVTWTIVDDPTDDVRSVAPTAPLPSGPISGAEVPVQDVSRWRRLGHGAPLSSKALAFKIIAALPAAGARDSVVVRQSEVDVLRQEYVDFAIPVPAAAEVKTAAQVVGLTRFTWAQLNQGDYGVAVLTPLLLTRLTELDVQAGGTLSLSSVFRNPVHQQFHITVSGGGRPVKVSQHQFGTAVDVRTNHDVEVWTRLRTLAKKLGACAEPMSISTSDHMHADWRPGSPTSCHKDW